jgi:phage nucleotide-binding protein
MKFFNSQDSQVKPSVVMMIYGEGGVGKTTFTSTAPTPILADCENGAKYLGLRGIKMDVAQIEKWSDMKDFLELAQSGKYETVIIDPIGELMDKLKRFMIAMGDSKLVQKDGSPTMAGWGWLKKTMRDYIKVLRDTGLHVIIVAHLSEEKDEDRIVKRPKIETKLSDELVSMVDIVAYMTVIQSEGEAKRILIVDPGNDKYTAKDRTGQLGRIIEPDFSKIINACQGTETYAWSKAKPVKESGEEPAPKKTAKKTKRQANECQGCAGPITEEEATFSKKMFKKELCRECQKSQSK